MSSAENADEVRALSDGLEQAEISEHGDGPDLERLAGEVVGEDQAGEVADRAREVLERMQADGKDGETLKEDIDNFTNVMLSMGLEVPRVLFVAAIEAGTLADNRKKALTRQAKKVSPITEVGSMQIDFVKDGEQRKAYIVYKRCGSDYDIGAQLAKIDPFVNEENQKKLREQLGHMDLLGRSALTRMVQENVDLLKKISKGLPEGFNPLEIVRRELSFFYECAPEQAVGLHIVYDTEAEAEKQAVAR